MGLLSLSSCLKETAIPIASSFEVTIAEDKTSPVTVKLQNNSYGADEYEWTFEGGVPASSRDRAPESVTFTEAGEHKIRLRVWNAVDERISEQVIHVDFFNDTATTEIYTLGNTLSLHDALPLTTLIIAYWQRYVTKEHEDEELKEVMNVIEKGDKPKE